MNDTPAIQTEALPVVQRKTEGALAFLLDSGCFEVMQRAAKLFSASDMLPVHYRGSLPNCFVALQLAQNLNVDPFMLMQNTYIVHGKPAMEGKLVIALVNARGPYKENLQFSVSGKGETLSCVCTGIRASGEMDTCTVDVAMAKKLGWYQKNEKWSVMTEQMLKYRSATWLARTHCPEVLMGLQTIEEVVDVSGPVQPSVMPRASLDDLNESIKVSVVEKDEKAVSETNPFDYEQSQLG